MNKYVYTLYIVSLDMKSYIIRVDLYIIYYPSCPQYNGKNNISMFLYIG